MKPRHTPEGSSDPLAAAQHPSASVAGVFELKMKVEGSANVAEVSSPAHKLNIDQMTDCAVDMCICSRRGSCRRCHISINIYAISRDKHIML